MGDQTESLPILSVRELTLPLPFLPELLDLNGTYDRLMRILYLRYREDVLDHDLRYDSRRVVADNRLVGSDYEEGFWHVITRGKDERHIDFRRAERIVWLRPLIENSDAPELYKWVETDADNRGRRVQKTYIWYREGRYMIVLKNVPKRHYFLVTAFYVTGARNDRYYFRKFQQAQKKGSGV